MIAPGTGDRMWHTPWSGPRQERTMFRLPVLAIAAAIGLPPAAALANPVRSL